MGAGVTMSAGLRTRRPTSEKVHFILEIKGPGSNYSRRLKRPAQGEEPSRSPPHPQLPDTPQQSPHLPRTPAHRRKTTAANGRVARVGYAALAAGFSGCVSRRSGGGAGFRRLVAGAASRAHAAVSPG